MLIHMSNAEVIFTGPLTKHLQVYLHVHVHVYMFTGASCFINNIDVGYKKGPVPHTMYEKTIWDGILFVPYIYFFDETSSSCDMS